MSQTPPSPDIVLDALTGFELTATVKAAIDLDLFTLIADGSDQPATLAEAAGATEKGMRVLCDFLTVRGFLTKHGTKYALTPSSEAFLNKRSPMYMGSISNFLASDHVLSSFKDVASVVRKGGSIKETTGLSPEHPMWVEFAESMAPMMMLPANLMAAELSREPVSKVLDIASSHGVFGIMVAQQNPQARLVGLDWANVVAYTKENASRFGVGDRFDAIAGSAFEVDFGTGYDLVLLPNFLHHFDHATNVQLLKKVKDALVQGGRVAICEFVPNEDRVSPPFPAMFSLMMLASTPSGDAYTEREFRAMIEEAGLSFVSRTDLLPSPQTLLVGRK